jgi:DNA polymerase-3 subunit gamma/tau
MAEEQFIVSARKYRPDTWESVVGQENITSTLQHAIETGHLAQAFLFCGPRGVGKTTSARIFAKSINQIDGEKDQDFAFNIFELDAASNNSVDDIRIITDQVRIPPQTGKYKVYIIDEVHMLSQAAFNAFLKTLEEPPPFAIFILATTEKHKIIPTILSRCQVYDFNRIKISDIAKHLAWIAEQEGIKAEPDALHVIAEKADGALRDALSIFDQIVSFCDDNITYDAVVKNLNILDYDYYFRITTHILANDIHKSLIVFDEILENGFDGHNFIVGLGTHFRNLLVCKDEITLKLLEVGDNIKLRYQEQSTIAKAKFLIDGLTILGEADVQYKSSKNQRLLVELSIMKLSSLTALEGQKKN